jgi:hypothetical protein
MARRVDYFRPSEKTDLIRIIQNVSTCGSPMITIFVYEKQTYLCPCVVVRRFCGRCIGANIACSASTSCDATIVFTDYWLNANSSSVFGSHPFHTGPSAASGASSDSG